jgi:hypothetical protein
VFKIKSTRINKKKRFTHVDFRLEFVPNLTGGFSKRKRSGIQIDSPSIVQQENVHGLVNGRLHGPKGRCPYHLKKYGLENRLFLVAQ